MGISQDTHTSTSQFSYLAMAFYVGFPVCEIPNAYLMQRFPVAKHLGVNSEYALNIKFSIKLKIAI